MGGPIIAGSVSEGADLIDEAGAGCAVAPGDARATADHIVRARGTDTNILRPMSPARREFHMRALF